MQGLKDPHVLASGIRLVTVTGLKWAQAGPPGHTSLSGFPSHSCSRDMSDSGTSEEAISSFQPRRSTFAVMCRAKPSQPAQPVRCPGPFVQQPLDLDRYAASSCPSDAMGFHVCEMRPPWEIPGPSMRDGRLGPCPTPGG